MANKIIFDQIWSIELLKKKRNFKKSNLLQLES